MPKFSQASFSKLATCHPDLQALFYEVIKSFDCQILEGYRNQADQHTAYTTGKSRLDWPDSRHNHQPSMAVDCAPYPINWSDRDGFYFFAGYVLGIAYKLKDEGKMTHSVRFGGDWNSDKKVSNENFIDLVHYELVD